MKKYQKYPDITFKNDTTNKKFTIPWNRDKILSIINNGDDILIEDELINLLFIKNDSYLTLNFEVNRINNFIDCFENQPTYTYEEIISFIKNTNFDKYYNFIDLFDKIQNYNPKKKIIEDIIFKNNNNPIYYNDLIKACKGYNKNSIIIRSTSHFIYIIHQRLETTEELNNRIKSYKNKKCINERILKLKNEIKKLRKESS